jgi:hypothetical protein
MRAVVMCALLLHVSVAAGAQFGSGSGPDRNLLSEPTCEDECKAQEARDDAVCDDRPLGENSRGFCHRSVRARFDICLRICED